MFDVGDSLRDAFAAARTRACTTRRPRSLGQTRRPAPGRSADAAMAQTAQAAIFTEALLGAERARFEEIKAVTK